MKWGSTLSSNSATPEGNLWTPDELQVLLLSEENTIFSQKMELLLAMLSTGGVSKQLPN